MMKSSRNLLVVLVVLAMVITLPCPSSSSSYTPDLAAQSVNANKAVSYQGITFTFDRSLASDVKTETIAASVAGKPSDIWPQHPGFSLVGYPRLRSLSERHPHIRVFSLDSFREALTIANKEYLKSLVGSSDADDWTQYLDTEVRVLKALLAQRPGQANARRSLAKLRGEEGCRGAMPFLPLWEACQAFIARVRYVKFRNGEGVIFLTQWDRETNRVTNEGLEYSFQGITNDGKFYISAEFSVAAPFLPNGDEPEVNEWNMKNYLLPHKSLKYQSYVRPIVAKLVALPSHEFRPNLRLIEKMLESLEVRTR